MSLKKLQKQLGRELKTNPKKAGMLALLAVAAVWFWFPLIFKPEPKQATVAAAPAAVAPVPMVVSGAPVVPAAEARPRWQDLAEAISNDPQMTPTALWDNGARSPFTLAAAAKQEQRKQEAEKKLAAQAEETRAAPERTPEELGLSVTSTLIGRNRRAAIINGELFEEGDELAVEELTFFVVVIEPNGVVLERHGSKHDLTIKRRTFSGRNDIRTAGN